ncbi:MAG: hypothetical protein ABEJ24_00435 [Candidatus Magasanikbacteria bacterium]
MDINSVLDQSQNLEPTSGGDDKIDDMLFDDDDDNPQESEQQKTRKEYSQEELQEKLKNLKEKIKSRKCDTYPEADAEDRLEEIERQSSTVGLESISGTVNDLKLDLENIVQETEQGLEKEPIQKLKENDISKAELKRGQKELLDLKEAYEERMERLWERVERLETELEEGDSGTDDFSAGMGDISNGGLGAI